MKFEMWSFLHYFLMLSPFITAIILYVITKKLPKHTNYIIGIILSSIAVILLVLRNLSYYAQEGQIIPEMIPFQICHFANFVLLFAFLYKNRSLFGVAFCFNMPLAFLSLLFANGLEGYHNILSIRGIAYMVGHSLIVGITLWAFLVGFVIIDKKAIKKGLAFLMALFFLSIPINNLFMAIMPGYKSNYFYSYLPESGTPLEMAYNWGTNTKLLGMTINYIYVFSTAIFGILLYLFFFMIYKIFIGKIIRYEN